MRLRILELPLDTVGEVAVTPFVLIFDRCAVSDFGTPQTDGQSIAEETGAKTVLFFNGDLELS